MSHMEWHRSSYSAANGQCVEVWRKSSRSSDTANCVEIADGEQVKVRDSKNIGPELAFSREAFAAFVDAVKHDSFR